MTEVRTGILSAMNPSTDILHRVEKIVGSKPLSWRLVKGGYTRAERWVMQLENDSSVFVKTATDEDTAKWLRDEQKVYTAIKGDFMPKYIGWDDGEFPILVLEDLSNATWSWQWNDDYIQRVLDTLKKVAATELPEDFPALTPLSAELTGWQEISKDPSGFLSLGLVSAEWLQKALPTLIEAEAAINLEGDSLVHEDIRSDNICFYGNKTIIIDWNWARRGNPKFDLITWLPSMHAEGGNAPWEITLDEPEMIAAIAGFFAAGAPKPPHKQGPAIRELQLKQLKSALPWAIKALKLPEPLPQ